MTDLYFNARSWRKVGLGEQDIKFLEGLLERVGGSTTPEQDLSSINDDIDSINTALATLDNTVTGLTIQVAAALQAIEDIEVTDVTEITNIQEVVESIDGGIQLIMAESSKLRNRVNQIEDAL